MNNILQRLKREFLGVIPAAVFFFIAFQLLGLTRAMILREHGVQISTFAGATVGALIVAKVVLIVDMLPFANRFRHKPLIYSVIWKTAIYLIAAFLVRNVERLVHLIREYGDFAVASSHLLEEFTRPHFWIVQMWLMLLFLMFSVTRELIQVLGSERVRTMFLGPIGTKSA